MVRPNPEKVERDEGVWRGGKFWSKGAASRVTEFMNEPEEEIEQLLLIASTALAGGLECTCARLQGLVIAPLGT